MTTQEEQAAREASPLRVPTQVYRIYIKATPQQVWDALTQPEWTERYGYGGIADYDLRPGGRAVQLAGPGMQAAGVTGPIVDGEVRECDPPNRLVLSFRMLMNPALEAEGFTLVTHELKQSGAGTRLTITHELENAPGVAALLSGAYEDFNENGGGGWAWVLSDLKTLLETGSTITPPQEA